jgi:hypothetical protein
LAAVRLARRQLTYLRGVVSPIRRWLSNVVRVAALIWLVTHFALTVTYVMPVNPIKLGLQPFLNATIGTYFPQNWSLFAPDPLTSDYAFLALPLRDPRSVT